jgi:hypothetical protein
MLPGGPAPLTHHDGAWISFPQRLFARWKNGLFGSMPVPLKLVVLPVPGSGYSGTPLARMHSENFKEVPGWDTIYSALLIAITAHVITVHVPPLPERRSIIARMTATQDVTGGCHG